MDHLHRLWWPCWGQFLRPTQLCSSKCKFILFMKVLFEFCCYQETTGRSPGMHQVLPCYTDMKCLSFTAQLCQRTPLRESRHAFGTVLSPRGQGEAWKKNGPLATETKSTETLESSQTMEGTKKKEILAQATTWTNHKTQAKWVRPATPRQIL